MNTWHKVLMITVFGSGMGMWGCSASGSLGTADKTIVRTLRGYEPVGGTAGAIIGFQMDNLADEMTRVVRNGTIERVGEGIRITFDSEILFATNSSKMKPAAEASIESLATVLNRYPETEILVAGYTDNTGTGEYYRKLSQLRAESIVEYAVTQQVQGSRLTVVGKGESDPVASNVQSAGRRRNRRLELVITAGKDMKNAAMNNERVYRLESQVAGH